MGLRIFLADDHKIVRDGLRALLKKQPDMEVVSEAEDGRTAVKQVLKIKPDVVIMDISMKNLNGIEATRQIVAGSPNIKILALSVHSDKQFITGILRAGASGYLLKDCTFEELINAIHVLDSNHMYLSPGIAGTITENLIHLRSNNKNSANTFLEIEECEIIQLLVDGNSLKKIAIHLNVSVKNVEKHRRKIMEKLNIRNLAGLTKYAVSHGLTSL